MENLLKKTIKLEKRRNRLALSGKYNEMVLTYSLAGFLENVNTPKFWDEKLAMSENKVIKNPMFDDKVTKILTFLKNKKGKLLTTGIGRGTIERKLNISNKYLKLYGIDISNDAIKNAKENIKGTFKQASILKIPFKPSFFDYILVLDVLEHIPPSKTFRAYEEIKRVLAKDGILLISVPLNEGLKELLRKNKNPNAHVRAYTPEILKAELKLSGFMFFKEIYLYAFSNLYTVKKLIMKIFPWLKKPNLVIIFVRK